MRGIRTGGFEMVPCGVDLATRANPIETFGITTLGQGSVAFPLFDLWMPGLRERRAQRLGRGRRVPGVGTKLGICTDAGSPSSPRRVVGVMLDSENGVRNGSVTGAALLGSGTMLGICTGAGSPSLPPTSGSASRWTP